MTTNKDELQAHVEIAKCIIKIWREKNIRINSVGINWVCMSTHDKKDFFIDDLNINYEAFIEKTND